MRIAESVALIVAAGNGQRFGDHPKQYIKINGTEILRTTIMQFTKHPLIDQVCVVINPEHYGLYLSAVQGLELLPVVFGGETRQQSVYCGLRALKQLKQYVPEYILVHDGCRPYVSEKLITSVMVALQDSQAVDVAMPISETLRMYDDATSSIRREQCYLAQTPQGFRFDDIMQAHSEVLDNQKVYTDDIAIAFDNNMNIKTVPGERCNIKITTRDDIVPQSYSQQYRVGYGYDIHAFDLDLEGSFVVLCGVKIPSKHNVIAHSDGDVAVHAIMDALLGAAGLGDIGDYFPPTDEKWRGVDSLELLRIVKSMLCDRDYKVHNIDLTIICETPRISGYKADMHKVLSDVLEIPCNCINIKATTSEKLGALGRGLGIAVHSIATITRCY